MTDLAAPAAYALDTPNVDVSLTGWVPRGELTFDEWEQAGRQLAVIGRACQWWIGDWIRYGLHRYGEKYDEAVERTGLDEGTLRNCVSVASRIDLSRRRDNLSFSHHVEVVALDPAEADEWLDRAERDDLAVHKLRAAIKASRDPAPDPDPDPPADQRLYSTTLTIAHAAGSLDEARRRADAIAQRVALPGVAVSASDTHEVVE